MMQLPCQSYIVRTKHTEKKALKNISSYLLYIIYPNASKLIFKIFQILLMYLYNMLKELGVFSEIFQITNFTSNISHLQFCNFS